MTQLRLQNFKGWKDTGVIRTAPITLFFGANSSGKSSIGQFLMMLKQTMESPDRKAVFYPGGKNSAVQLGSYKEMVFHRDLKNKITFDYQWGLDEPFKIKDIVSDKAFSGSELSFSAEVGLNDKDQLAPKLYKLKYDLLEKGHIILSIGLQRQSDDKAEYKIDTKQYNLKRNMGRAWNYPDPVRFYGFPDEVVAYHQNAEFVQNLNLRHEQFFRSLSYLGPLRTKTERIYSWSGVDPESVGYSGENTVAAILASQSRKLGLGFKRFTRPFEEIIATKLKEMALIEDFKVKRISEERQDYEVKLRTRGSGDWVDLPDVGFGISQVLPVLVQCFYAPPRSIILMEQPEIHLHPSAQSALADVLIDVVNSKENGRDRNIQLIIETHSEHFLRRLQRRIAENKIPQGKVSAYFADITRSPATLKPLELDIFGNIGNWPANFFGDEMQDIVAQSRAALKTRRQNVREDSFSD